MNNSHIHGRTNCITNDVIATALTNGWRYDAAAPGLLPSLINYIPKGRPCRVTPAQRLDPPTLRALLTQGLRQYEIAALLHVDNGTVSRYCKHYGLGSARSIGSVSYYKRGFEKRHGRGILAQIIKMRHSGATYATIATRVGMTGPGVAHALRMTSGTLNVSRDATLTLPRKEQA